MNKYYYEGKTKEQAEELALEELKVSKEDYSPFSLITTFLFGSSPIDSV